MTDYKATLNLPKTAFPMKANLAQREPQQLKHWGEIYSQIRAAKAGKPLFILHDGPPYANARPHMGTALNKTIKDIIIKAKGFSGRDAPFIPGWDCHGLPIELNVEKKKGKAGDKLSPAMFRQACRDYAIKQVDMQREDFKRLGVFADWENPYLTMAPQYEANVVRALAKMLANGHLKRGQKPVHWCPVCSSALAEAEVEYKDKTSPSIDVAFVATQPEEVLAAFGDVVTAHEIIFPIWTTTPWTLPANQAVALHEALDYVLVECSGDRVFTLVVAKDLLDTVLERYAVTDYSVLAEAAGAALAGFSLQHPLMERTVPTVLADHVTTEAGTGNVHTAPVHGPDDYQVGLAYQLPQDNPVNSKSCFVEGTPVVAGLHVYKANEPMLAALRERGVLLSETTLQHSYPHCWRHKTPIIFRATPQWFIGMDHLLPQAVCAAEKTTWLPAASERRFLSMLNNRPDWCISRQRTWGTPITLIIHRDTGELHPEMLTLMEVIARRMDEGGMEAWHALALNELIDDADQYEKTTDILDVWFDAGVSHFAVLEQRLQLPADLYFEGSDQHRGWFQTSLLTSTAMRESAPFKQVLTHGFVVDKDGRKMSKSVGNVVSPIDVVNKYGADVLRLWACASDYTNDIAYSEEIVQRNADAYRRIRNTARFLLSNLNDFDPATDLVDDLVALDRWAIAFAAETQAKVIAAYDTYQFQDIYQLLHNFCSVEMGSFYLDIVKDRLYTAKGVARRSCQTALYYIAEALVRWIAPVLSFTAEEIWRNLPGEHEASVFFAEWFDLPAVDGQLAYWSRMMAVRDDVNKALETMRQAGDIGSGLDVCVTMVAQGEALTDLRYLDDELRFILITSDAKVLEGSANIHIDMLSAEKCVRCWQRRDDVVNEICGRCRKNVEGVGEVRRFG